MKSKHFKEEILNSLSVYKKVLEYFSGTFSENDFFLNQVKFLKENIFKREEIIKSISHLDEKIMVSELFTPEKTYEKFKFVYEKIKMSEISLEAAYSLVYGIENSIFEKLSPITPYLKENDPLKDFLDITKSNIRELKGNSRHLNLTFL